MAKVMLVEDDNNLREIYEARMQAEGYDVVSAKDGEEALVVAKAEKPDLVISDVMMPKISGFEMLDILRNTEGLKDVKVIMLTALGQSDDQQRADRLGADKYLVKSQVTLEDIVNVAHQLLGDTVTAAEPIVAAVPAPMAAPTPVPAPVAPVPAPPVAEPTPAPAAVAVAPTSVPAEPVPAPPTATGFAAVQVEPPVVPAVAPPADPVAAADDQLMANALNNLVNNTTPAEAASTPVVASVPAVGSEPALSVTTSSQPIAGKKIISPIDSGEARPDINALLAKEEAKNTQVTPETVITPSAEITNAPTAAQEEATVEAQIEDFVSGATSDANPTVAPAPVATAPEASTAVAAPTPVAAPVLAPSEPVAPTPAAAPASEAAPIAAPAAVVATPPAAIQAPPAPVVPAPVVAPVAEAAPAPAPATPSDKPDPSSISL